MPFPDAEHATASETKVRDYLLNLDHSIGGAKAVWFRSLGYDEDNWQELADGLVRCAQDANDFLAKSSPYGLKYEVSGWIGLPGRRPGLVVSVWIVEENDAPRLVTAYPG